MTLRLGLSFLCARLGGTAAGLYRQYSAGQPNHTGILSAYQRLVADGQLQADPTQLAAVQALQLLQDGLLLRLQATAQQQLQQQQQFHAHVTAATTADAANGDQSSSTSGSRCSSLPVQGAYLWGPVGSGKTRLMDIFLQTLPTVPVPESPPHSTADLSTPSNIEPDSTDRPLAAQATVGGSMTHPQTGASGQQQQLLCLQAERLHFHTFMLGVHQQLHQLQQSLPRVVGRSRAGLPVYRHALPPEDPILVVARAAAAHTDVLCLDELHVADVADAMLLSRLLRELLHCGCMVLFTSNRPPRDLYKGGLSRKYFEPFIHLVDNRLLQLRVAGGQDYRLSTSTQSKQQQQQQQHGQPGSTARGAGRWLVGPDSNKQLQQQWQQLAQDMAALVSSATAAGSAAHGGAAHAASTATQAVPVPGDTTATIPLPFNRSLWVPKAIVQPHIHPEAPQQTLQDQHQNMHPPAPAAAAQQHQIPHHHQHHHHHHQQQQASHQASGVEVFAGVYFTFDQLCGNSGSRSSLAQSGALSANDYLALVGSCRQLFVEGVTQLQPSQRDEARRLVTLVDLVYEAHTLHPGAVQLCVSAEVPPHQLFLPLLGAAACQGVNPNLGRSGSKLDVKELMQGAKASINTDAAPGSGIAGEDATVGARQSRTTTAAGTTSTVTGQALQPQPPPSPAPLLAEEVLMYHRASSRLVELCANS